MNYNIGDYVFIDYHNISMIHVISCIVDKEEHSNTLILSDITNFSYPEDINNRWRCDFNSDFKVVKKIEERNIKNFKEKNPHYFI